MDGSGLGHWQSASQANNRAEGYSSRLIEPQTFGSHPHPKHLKFEQKVHWAIN